MAKELPKRSEVRVEDTWNLADMYKSDSDWEKDLDVISGLGDELKEYKGKVCESAASLLSLLEKSTELEIKIELSAEYAARLKDQDTADTGHQAMYAKIFSLISSIGADLSFINPEIIEASEELLEGFYVTEPGLEFYRNYIKEIRRLKPHSLSAEIEKVVAMTSEMGATPQDVRSILDNADMTFPEVTDEDGEKVRITHGRFVRLLESADRRVRKDTFEAFYSEYEKFLATYAALYNGQVKKALFHSKVRNYPSSLEAAVDRNNVSPKVYKILVDTVNANLDKLHRYVSLRKKCLNLDELHMYDIYTPMIPDVAKKYTYEEAKDLVLKAVAPLGEDYVATVKKGFDERWVDVYENQGKRSGAYSAGAYCCHPYVLMNFSGSLDEVFTLAHEMGHAMHSYYSNQAQPYIYSRYKIFVAEVASTCNEMLLLDYLLKNTEDRDMKFYLLNHYLDSFKGTIFRQTQFAEFEMLTHEMVQKGEALNKDNLSKLYLDINKRYYGPDMNSDPYIAYEWARIPHFYYNFYVYQYATSMSASVAIAQRILKEGEPMVKRYRDFLASGCTLPPVDLLRQVDIDLETPAPIQLAMDVCGTIIDEMESML